ncbi:MAG: terminase family protein, partial [Oscillospiraceae bacterium]|nr:terminase family protein [Oscillospiraceae bacterium]
MRFDIGIYQKQKDFINSTGKANEVLYGGAAGGGKSYGQLIDALIYATRYPKSRQLILRRTLPELEKSLIRVSLEIFPAKIYKYSESKHTGTFSNGSVIDFGYCDSESDVYRYQSAEYDVIRFDELTHFTEQMYLYL